MLVQKTIKAKIVALTQSKQEALSREYANWQMLIHSLDTNEPNCIDAYESAELYSATKQQALRFSKKLGFKYETPLIIRRDTTNIKKTDNKLAKYWAKIPIYKHSIRVAIQFPNNQESLLMESIRQAMLVRKGKEWFLHITVQKEIKMKKSYSSILSIDLGEKVIATTVLSCEQRPTFYGREVRGIRRHYTWLRKVLGENKKMRTIKKIGQTESRKINDILHKIANQIVMEAEANDSIIVIGNLKGIRQNSLDKGTKFRRIVASMPYYKLTSYVEYKAGWKGIQVLIVDEWGTSHECSVCGQNGIRPYQGLFQCPHCGYQVNADFNGAKNIAKRGLENISSSDGVRLTEPITLEVRK